MLSAESVQAECGSLGTFGGGEEVQIRKEVGLKAIR